MSLCFHCLQLYSLSLHSSLTLGAFKQPPLSCFWLKKPKPRQRLLLAPRHLKAPPQGRASGQRLKKPLPRPPKVLAKKAKPRRGTCALSATRPICAHGLRFHGDSGACYPFPAVLVYPPFGRRCSAGAPAGCGCSFAFLPTRAKNSYCQSAFPIRLTYFDFFNLKISKKYFE